MGGRAGMPASRKLEQVMGSLSPEDEALDSFDFEIRIAMGN